MRRSGRAGSITMVRADREESGQVPHEPDSHVASRAGIEVVEIGGAAGVHPGDDPTHSIP